MQNKLSILTGIILLGSIVTNAKKAEAIIFEFNDFNPSGNAAQDTASGFFEINDLNDDGIVDFTGGELVDANIEVFNSGGDFVVGGGLEKLVTSNIAGVSVNDNLLDFSSATSGQLDFQDATFGSFFLINANGAGFEIVEGGNFGFPCCTFTAAPVPVPFEVSPTLGFLIVGGIWGVSRLRKKIAARK